MERPRLMCHAMKLPIISSTTVRTARARRKRFTGVEWSNANIGQRREPAADDVRFVSERIGWLPVRCSVLVRPSLSAVSSSTFTLPSGLNVICRSTPPPRDSHRDRRNIRCSLPTMHSLAGFTDFTSCCQRPASGPHPPALVFGRSWAKRNSGKPTASVSRTPRLDNPTSSASFVYG